MSNTTSNNQASNNQPQNLTLEDLNASSLMLKNSLKTMCGNDADMIWTEICLENEFADLHIEQL